MKEKIQNSFTRKDSERIKGIAIILLVIHHCFMTKNRYAGHEVSFFPFEEETVIFWAAFFKICVGMFVFITGYGMMQAYKKKKADLQLSVNQFKNIVLTRYLKLISGFMYVFVMIVIYSKVANTGWFTQTYGKEPVRYIYVVIDFLGLAHIFGTPSYMATFWYMSLIQLLIFVMPLLVIGYRKVGGGLLYILVLVSAVSVKFTYPELPRFALCIVLGMICADKDIFAKIKNYNPIRKVPIAGKILKFILYIVMILVLAYLRQNNVYAGIIGFWDSIVPFVIIAFCNEFIIHIPVVAQVLGVLGKYSLYIFLTHNFIRIAWYNDFTYSFYYAPLIVVMLILTSLAVSIVLDVIRKIIRLDMLVNKLIQKLTVTEN